MARFAGQPVLFVAATLTMWMAFRVISLTATSPTTHASTRSVADNQPDANTRHQIITMASLPRSQITRRRALAPRKKRIARHAMTPTEFSTALPWAEESQPSRFVNRLKTETEAHLPYGSGTTPQAADGEWKAGNPITPIDQAALAHAESKAAMQKPQRLSAYVYSFWRDGERDKSVGLAPMAQYGGSQSGALALWDVAGRLDQGAAILLRASITPNGVDQEIAAGVRWKPVAKIPMSATIERRILHGRADRFAVYLSGGRSLDRVIGDIEIDFFGQAGIVTGRESEHFMDAQMHAMKPVGSSTKPRLKMGVGCWVGGQGKAIRWDVGPSFSSDVPLGNASLKFQVDWRFALNKNIVPNGGPAVTVSGGF